jgi:hypothetical protein
MRAPLSLAAIVTPAEQAAVIAGAEQLSACLGEAGSGGSWPIQLNLMEPMAELAAGPAPAAIIASLLCEAEQLAEPIDSTTERWRVYLAGLQATGAPVFLVNVFRHVAGRARDGSASPALERIRRLDLMAVRLSHELGIGLVDIDRAFAHIGARALRSDYRLNGLLATEVAGHTLAWGLLSFGLDDAIDPTLQEKARAALGPLSDINAIVGRRLAARRARTPSAQAAT